jgi:hypothetical protein
VSEVKAGHLLKYNKIPIWENQRRIKDLTFFRDLWAEGLFGAPNVLISPTTGKPFSPEQRRTELNRRISGVREMVALAGISALRDWPTFRKDDPPLRLDILEQFWYIEKHRLSGRAPSDVVEEAIGVYQADRNRSWIRTCNPFFWMGRFVDWFVGGAFNVVTLFGGDPEVARNSRVGRSLFSAGKLIFEFFVLAAAVCTVLQFLGYQTPVQHFLDSAHEKQAPASAEANQGSAILEGPPPYVPPNDRVFTGITPAQVHDFFVGKTDVQARAQLQFYLNTWVQVSGSLKDVFGDKVSLSEFVYPSTIGDLTMQFRQEKWLQRLRVMKVGTKLKIVGELTAANQLLILLDNCEIVQDETTQKAATPEKPPQ